MEDFEDILMEKELTDEEVEELYSEYTEVTDAPIEHTIEEALEGSVDEDKGVVFDEISE